MENSHKTPAGQPGALPMKPQIASLPSPLPGSRVWNCQAEDRGVNEHAPRQGVDRCAVRSGYLSGGRELLNQLLIYIGRRGVAFGDPYRARCQRYSRTTVIMPVFRHNRRRVHGRTSARGTQAAQNREWHFSCCDMESTAAQRRLKMVEEVDIWEARGQTSMQACGWSGCLACG